MNGKQKAILKNNFCLLFILISITVVNFSCAKTVQAFKVPDKEMPPETTRIYLIRPSFYGTAITANIYANNNIVGRIGPKGYVAWDAQPGSITLQSGLNFVKLLALPGKTYYFKLQPKPISFNKHEVFEFIEISAEEGIHYLSKLTPPKVKVVS